MLGKFQGGVMRNKHCYSCFVFVLFIVMIIDVITMLVLLLWLSYYCFDYIGGVAVVVLLLF